MAIGAKQLILIPLSAVLLHRLGRHLPETENGRLGVLVGALQRRRRRRHRQLVLLRRRGRKEEAERQKRLLLLRPAFRDQRGRQISHAGREVLGQEGQRRNHLVKVLEFKK